MLFIANTEQIGRGIIKFNKMLEECKDTIDCVNLKQYANILAEQLRNKGDHALALEIIDNLYYKFLEVPRRQYN